MYAVCASRYVSRQMVPVALCGCAEGFILWKNQRRTAYIASTTTAVFRFCCGRLGTALTPLSSLRTLTGLAFVPAALIVSSSLKSEGGVLLHSWFPIKFTLPTSPPIATICVIRIRAATWSLFQGPAGWCLDFVQLAFWSTGSQSDNGSDHLLSNQPMPVSPVLSHWWGYHSHHCPRMAHMTCWSYKMWFLKWKCSSPWLPSL